MVSAAAIAAIALTSGFAALDEPYSAPSPGNGKRNRPTPTPEPRQPETQADHDALWQAECRRRDKVARQALGFAKSKVSQ